MTKSHKIVAIISGAILLVMFVISVKIAFSPQSKAASHISTATSTDISDWKTYRNEKYGFEIKVPTDWSATTVEDDVIFRDPQSVKDSEKAVSDCKVNGNCFAVHHTNLVINFSNISKSETSNRGIYKVNENSFWRFETAGAYWNTIHYQFNSGRSPIDFSVSSRYSEDEQYLKTILSTFKFTIGNTASGALEWKTYSDSVNGAVNSISGAPDYDGFRINIPATWHAEKLISVGPWWRLSSGDSADGMGIEIAPTICHNPGSDAYTGFFVADSVPGIVQASECKDNFNISLILLQTDPHLKAHEELLEKILPTFEANIGVQ